MMKRNYSHLAAQIFNVPLLVHPQKLDAIIAGLGPRLLGTDSVELEPSRAEASLPAELFSTRRGEKSDNGYRVVDGVAVLFASGALVHRSMVDANSSYLLGYNEIAAKLEAAADDPDVHAVLQIYDSPGGQVAGAFEYGDRIHALRGKKPMWAIADDMAASAAYLAGSAFQRLAVTATGYLGSIGVVLRHVDFSRALANDGIKVTQIYAGAHKVDGNPYEPLPRDVQAELQGEVDAIHGEFVGAVVRNRGLAEDAVRATQAQTYRGPAAVAAGLADRVATTDQLITELAALRARSYPAGPSARSTASNPGGSSMSGTTQGGQTAAQNPPALTREALERDHPALFAQVRSEFLAEGERQGTAQGRADGAQAERERVAGVRAALLPGHEALVEQLAADGKTTPAEAAAAVIAAERQATAAAAAAHKADAPDPAKRANVTSDKPEATTVAQGAVALFNRIVKGA